MKRLAFTLGILVFASAVLSHPARAQVYVTSITAAEPDPEGKVPAFNAVPGAGIPTWSNGLAQAVLTHGHYYNYCVSMATAAAKGSASVHYFIVRGSDILQSKTIISAAKFNDVVSNGIWYYCSGYYELPDSPGAATLIASVVYTPKGVDHVQDDKDERTHQAGVVSRS